MYDGGKILTGLGAFIAVALLPFWLGPHSASVPKPEPKIVTQAKECVEPAALMRATHMDLLNRWRNAVVRDGERTTKAVGGRVVQMNLSEGCMKCHPNKSEFCDRCHNYLAVSPTCWECHVEPTEKGRA